MHNIIVIEKYGESSFFWPNLLRLKQIKELSVNDLLIKYQGFEGDLLYMASFESQQNKTNALTEIIREQHDEIKENKCAVLHVLSESDAIPNVLFEEAIHLGYDVGVCEKEKTIYSSIFNEILFGNLSELMDFKNVLNENFLFPNILVAKKYIKIHAELSRKGKGVEDYEDMLAYNMWKHIV